MEFKKGFSIKPKEIDSSRIVVFTDGTNDVYANELACVSYGYTYDAVNGVCIMKGSEAKVQDAFKNNNNLTKGGRAETGTSNSLITGTKNRAKGQNKNISVSGERHEVDSGVINASVIGGKMGKALRQGEVVIGGGSFNSKAGVLQQSFIQVAGKTTDSTATNLTAQSNEVDIIPMQAHSIVIFEAFLIALATNTANGVRDGEHKSTKIKGSIATNGGLDLTITQNETVIVDTINGVVSAQFVQTDNQLALEVTGIGGVNITWACTINFYEHKSLASTF